MCIILTLATQTASSRRHAAGGGGNGGLPFVVGYAREGSSRKRLYGRQGGGGVGADRASPSRHGKPGQPQAQGLGGYRDDLVKEKHDDTDLGFSKRKVVATDGYHCFAHQSTRRSWIEEEGPGRERPPLDAYAGRLGSTLLPPDVEEGKWLMRRFLLDLRQKLDEDDEELELENEPGAMKLHVEQLREAGPDTSRLAGCGSLDRENEIIEGEKRGDGNKGLSTMNKNIYCKNEAAGGLVPNVFSGTKETNKETDSRIESSAYCDGDNCKRGSPSNRPRSSDNDNAALLRHRSYLYSRENGGRWDREDRGLGNTIRSGRSTSSSHNPREARPATIGDGLQEVTSWIKSLLPQAWLRETDSHSADNKDPESERARGLRGNDDGSIDLEDNIQRTGGPRAASHEMEEWGPGDSELSSSGSSEDEGTVGAGVTLNEIGATSLALWLKDRDYGEVT